MPDLNEPILTLVGDLVDPADPELQTLERAQMFFERRVGEGTALSDREIALSLLGLAGVRLQMRKSRGARHTLAHLRTRFRGQFRDLEQLADFFEVVLLINDGKYSEAAEATDGLVLEADMLRTRKRLECFQHYLRSEIMLALGKTDGAITYLNRALERLRGEVSQRVDLALMAAVYLCEGRVYDTMSQHQEAVVALGRADTICDHIVFPLVKSRVEREKGRVLSRRGQADQAIQHLRLSLRLAKDYCSPFDIVRAAIRLGRVYYGKREYANAMLYFEEARVQCGDGRFPNEEAEVNSRIGDILVTEGRYAQAAKYYEVDLAISMKSGNSTARGHALKGMGRINRLLGNYDTSERYLLQARELFETSANHSELSNVLLQLALCYISEGKVNHAVGAVDSYKTALNLANRMAENGMFPMLEGLILRREGLMQEASLKLEQSLDMFMVNPGFYAVLCALELAQLYEEWGLLDNSVTYYRAAIKLARDLRICDMEKRALSLLSRVDRTEWAKLLHDQAIDKVGSTGISRTYVAVVMFEFRGGEVFSGIDDAQVTRLLDQFFDAVVAAVAATGGVLSRLMGTRVMVVYGLAGSLEPGKALHGAWRVINLVEGFIPKELDNSPVGVAAAITTGECLAGALGPIDGREHGVFGMPVDLAHLLVSNAKIGDTLLGPATLQAVAHLVTAPESLEISVPGHDKKLTVYQASAPGVGRRNVPDFLFGSGTPGPAAGGLKVSEPH